MIGYRVAFLCLTVFFGLAFIISSCFHYQNKFNTKYRLKHMFPFEFNYNSRFIENFWGNFTVIMSSLAMVMFYIFYTKNRDDGILVFITVAGILLACLQCALVFVPLKNLKAHLLVSILTFAMDFALAAGIAIAGFKSNQIEITPYGTISFIAGTVVALMVLALIINPKLNANFKYNVKKDANGNDVYERPKFIVLAFSEWVLILTMYINLILTFVLSFVL